MATAIFGIKSFVAFAEIYFTVDLTNKRFPSFDAPFFNDVGLRLSGTNYLAQLYSGTTRNDINPTGPVVSFFTNNGSGYFRAGNGVNVQLLGQPRRAYFQVRCWAAIGGDTFEAAVRHGFWTGVSSIFDIEVFDFRACDIPCSYLCICPMTYPGLPLIVDQPIGKVIRPGESAKLEIVASGSILMSYQWYEGLGGDVKHAVPAATNSVLITAPLTVDSRFWCRLTTAVGSTDSDAGEVKVLPPEEPYLRIGLSNRFSQIWIFGPTNVPLRLQYANSLSVARWDMLSKVTLPVSPFQYSDPTDLTEEQRFYRILPP